MQQADSDKIFPNSSRFFINLPHYRIDTFLADKATTLVVTFEPMGRIKEFGSNRRGWGVSFLQEQGCSVMAVMVKEYDWYRKPDLKAFFMQMRQCGFFRSFEQVVTYGGSMGGFAALAHADAVNAAVVLSINPQATLSAQLAPWETRFDHGRKQDWQGELAHAADGFKQVQAAYVVYDPLFPLDAKHVSVLAAGNPQLVRLKIPVVGHHMPKWMAEMGLLKSTLTDILAGQFSVQHFHHEARKRRLIKRYWLMLAAQPRVVKSARFTQIARHYAATYGFPLPD
jgi:hypothetical protein